MKTSLACLCLLVAALIVGNIQGSRFEKLKQQLPSSAVAYRSKAYERESPDHAPVYRSRFKRTSRHALAKDVFQSVLEFSAGRKSVMTGELASMTNYNKGALKAVMQLDISGLKELITLISKSKDPVLNMNSVIKYEQITLCIIAMADQDPGYALDYVINAENEIDPKVFRDEGTRFWLKYVLIRLGDHDAQRALDGLLKVSGEQGDDWVLAILAILARQDPGLVLNTIDRLPEAKSQYFLESLAFRTESADERSALFFALRDHYRFRTDQLKAGLESLFRTTGYANESPAEFHKWANSLGMSDPEKLLAFESLNKIDPSGPDGEIYARWFATFMPESDERKALVWKSVNVWVQTQADELEAIEFLKEQAIDPQEMIRRERGK